MTGVDPTRESIEVASAHVARDPELSERVKYECKTVEDIVAEGRSFSVVVASEVIEHVNNPASFVQSCASALKVSSSMNCLYYQPPPQLLLYTGRRASRADDHK